MAPLKKALITLFGGRGKVPSEQDLDRVAKRIFTDICDTVQGDAPEDGPPVITRQDMYAYLVKNSETGISSKTVDALFNKVDVDRSGSISQEEFVQVLRRCHALLMEELRFNDARVLTHSIPDNHVIPGSCSMNAKSGTNAFRMEVVRRQSMKRMWEVFCGMDLDKDGLLSIAEFKHYLKWNKPELLPMANSIFHSLDKNRNGTVSFKELIAKLYPEASKEDVKKLLRMARPEDYLPAAKVDEELMAEIRQIFTIYDDDRSGSLDEEEFAHALALTGFDHEEAKQMFLEIDRDGSGEVSYGEFEYWYVNSHARRMKVLAEADRDSNASDSDDDEAGQ